MKLFILEVKNIDIKQVICMLNKSIASRERVILHPWPLLFRYDQAKSTKQEVMTQQMREFGTFQLK